MLIKQIESIVNNKYPLITNLSNVSAVINQWENINWCGFYLVGEDGLYLGPFQGEVACSYIPFDKGICGKCFRQQKAIIVDDVNQDKDHIACSALSKSEIVVPIIKNEKVVALIDIDSPYLKRFDNQDKETLEKIAKILEKLF